MTEDSSEMNELYGRGLDGKKWVMNGRLMKKEIKREEEEPPKNTGGGIEKGEMANGDNGKGNNASSSVSSDHPNQSSAISAISPPLMANQPQLSVKVEEQGQAMTNSGDSVVDQLKKLRAAAVENERALKDKEMLNSMLLAKLEQVKKDKKAIEQQLRDENTHQCAELERRLVEEQQKNAQLSAELKGKEKPNNMDKETETDMTMDHSVDKETSTAVQPSRAAIAAQLLGIDAHLLEEPQPNECKEKLEQLTVKYLKVKKLYRTEQKIAAKLRKKLQDTEKAATSEELSLAQFSGADLQQPVKSNEALSTPVQRNMQQRVRKSQRRLGERMDFALPPPVVDGQERRQEDAEEGRVKEMDAVATGRSVKATIIRGHHQWIGEGRRQKPVPPAKQMENEKGAASTVATVSDGVFKCAQCAPNKVAFSSTELLTKHQQRFHGPRQHYRLWCQECGLPCVSNHTLEKHRRTHTGEKPFKCQRCGRGFAQKGDLTVHERTHTGERPYACAVCQRAFTDSRNLIKHARVHSGELPFSCQHCARKFSRPTNCRQHEKVCAGRPSASE